MAKLKLQSSKKTVNKRKEELKAPDEVTTHLQKLSEHLNDHFKLYLAGLGGIIVLTLAVTWFVDYRREKAREHSEAVVSVTETILSPVGEHADEALPMSTTPDGQEEEKPTPKFATAKERWDAAGKQVETAVEQTDDQLKGLAKALEGRIRLAQGEPVDAGKAFSESAGLVPDSPFVPLLVENQGHAAAAAGDLAAAAGFFAKLADSRNPYYRARGQILLGDLYNPAFGKGSGKDPAKAKEHYEAALEALRPAEGQVIGTPLRDLRTEVSRRKALL